MKNIKYSFEYFCSPIWVKENFTDAIYENVDIDNLQISDTLKAEIKSLDAIYQSTYNEEYPPEPKKLSSKEGISFCNNVIGSARKLSNELSSQYHVTFDKTHWQEKMAEYE